MQPPATYARGNRAFTLIELLIVVSIMIILAGMLSVMMVVAQRQGRVANTRTTLMKVDQAIRLFRTDMRIYPWQTDLGTAPAEPAQWDNNLAFRLAWDPPAPADATASDPDRITYMRKFHEDISAIQQKFRFVDGSQVGSATEGTHAFRSEMPGAGKGTNVLPAPGTLGRTPAAVSAAAGFLLPGASGQPGVNDATSHAQSLTRMAEELSVLAYTAGSMPVEAPKGIDPALPADKALFPAEDENHPSFTWPSSSGAPFRYLPYNKAGVNGDDSRGPVLTSATAKAAGWRSEYLAHASSPASAAGNRVEIDATGRMFLDAWGRPLVYVCSVRPGVRGRMHTLEKTIWSGAIESRYNMGPQGRTATALLASDVRTTAAAAYRQEFELWSAGIDGRFAGMRNDPVNADNIALHGYAKGLQ